MLETKIVRRTSIEDVLRLICLLSYTLSGLKKEEFEHLRKIII